MKPISTKNNENKNMCLFKNVSSARVSITHRVTIFKRYKSIPDCHVSLCLFKKQNVLI